jgi:Na+-translocating ferredoxin:NAD+ oxidoreductase RnfG subunit
MKNRLTYISAFILFIALTHNAMAIRLLDREQALKKMFPEAEEIITEKRELTVTEIEQIKEKLGGNLAHFQKKSESNDTTNKIEYVFYFNVNNGQKSEVAIIEQQPGKWGPVEFIIVLDADTAKIKNVAVMSYKEKRGRPIARRNFLKQFFDKSSKDPIKVRKDIRAISGATISSDCACFAIKKAIALYEVLFLKEEKVTSLESKP